MQPSLFIVKQVFVKLNKDDLYCTGYALSCGW